MMCRVIAVAIAVVVRPGISDGRASHAAHDSADRAPDNRSRDSTPDRAGDRAVLIGKAHLRRRQEKRRRGEKEMISGHERLQLFGE
jgi:cell division septation protein DedD